MKYRFYGLSIACAAMLSACTTPTEDVSSASASAAPVAATPTGNVLPAVVCADQTQTLRLTPNAVSQQGTVQGYNYCEYQIQMRAGQRLNVSFSSPSPQVQAIVYDNASVNLSNEYVAPIDLTLPVRVLLTRNEARSRMAYPFRIAFTATK